MKSTCQYCQIRNARWLYSSFFNKYCSFGCATRGDAKLYLIVGICCSVLFIFLPFLFIFAFTLLTLGTVGLLLRRIRPKTRFHQVYILRTEIEEKLHQLDLTQAKSRSLVQNLTMKNLVLTGCSPLDKFLPLLTRTGW